MPAIVVVLIIIVVIADNWDSIVSFAVPAGLGIGLITLMVHANKSMREANEKAERQKQAEAAELERERYQQNSLHRELISLGGESLRELEIMPTLINDAESHLDRAEHEFSERAFSPFWDAIEKAVRSLAEFDLSISNIERNSTRYVQTANAYKGKVPAFPISAKSTSKLSAAEPTSSRLKEIVRKAQRDFQFATIYEQRKTNQILIAGFTNLAQALDTMQTQLSESIDGLVASVDSLSAQTSAGLDRISDQLKVNAADAASHQQESLKFSRDAGAREQRVVEMLDNIQRHRKPPVI